MYWAGSIISLRTTRLHRILCIESRDAWLLMMDSDQPIACYVLHRCNHDMLDYSIVSKMKLYCII